MNKNLIVKCVVACVNCNGEPDFYFVMIRKQSEDTDIELVINKAIDACENNGYESTGRLVYTPDDYSFKAFARNAFDWKNADIISV